ncbi:MAG: response regulator [Paraburkholderia tropica]|uniref:Two-component system response regulator BaeR n=1 Tax=Paraburkholderia tropica TaxID=92647 RepID=A0ABX5MGD5_9BURK|nr:response regulator [Paraburkholderia tropica]MDE1138481.1 response regulator [Paraburkholderia tropica]PXX02447.1 two-component system response regulator BaeR [Paraburkholderia tropica]PZW69153.1 two-component system response regulator BaeR [Paraburkholderia tropica]
MSNETPIDILIVEDEPKLASVMADFLQAAGYTTRCVDDGREVANEVARRMPGLIVLDLMLPGRDGRDICRDLRTYSDVPIIMVTAQVEEVDRLIGLELGADDYICKPFSLLELVARAKAILRRSRFERFPESVPLQLDEERFVATFRGVEIELTPIEFRLLRTLAARPGRVFSRDVLMDRLYPDGRIVEDRTIDSHVKKIRRKFETVAPDDDVIQSVYGAGFRLAL